MSDVIVDGSVVVVQRYNYLRTHTINTKGGEKVPKMQLGKDLLIDMTSILGCQFGTTFKMTKADPKDKEWKLVKTEEEALFEEEGLLGEGGQDNRDLVDENSSQKLSKAEIEEMKESGVGGSAIVAKLVENSQSFQNKTKFSQEKFLKKKAKKYFEYLVIRKPSIRLLMQIHYKADPLKILNLRIDSLSQLLNQTNIRSGAKVMVYETGCQGLIVAAALERIGENGKLIHIFQTGNPQTQSLNAMNFEKPILDNLSTLNMYHLRSLEQGHDITQMHNKDGNSENKSQQLQVPFRQRLREQSITSYEVMKDNQMDGLIIACKQHPTSILLTLMRYLSPSRPFAVFSPYKEPLLDAYIKVKESGKAVMVTLSESWLRHHQVLPQRTHPEVMMSGGGGYILSGIYVDNTDLSDKEEENGEENHSGSKKKFKRFRKR